MIHHKPKLHLPEWYGDILITEKVKGLYRAIYIAERMAASDGSQPAATESGLMIEAAVGVSPELRHFEVKAADRNGFLSPEEFDESGFADWAFDNASDLLVLGPGIHAGTWEWWGPGSKGIFSLHDANRWYDFNASRFELYNLVSGLHLVPPLYRGPLVMPNGTDPIAESLRRLAYGGSKTSSRKPVGVVITHLESGYQFEAPIARTGP